MRFQRDPHGQGRSDDGRGGGARQFVEPDVTPGGLVALFRDHIGSHAEEIARPAYGKWIRLVGPRGDVIPRRRGIVLLRFDRQAGQPYTRVEMKFRSSGSLDRLRTMPRGTELTVIGTIKGVTRSQLLVDDCEIDESQPTSTS